MRRLRSPFARSPFARSPFAVAALAHSPFAVAALALGLVLGAAGCGGDSQSSAPTELEGIVRTPARNVAAVTLPDETPGADGQPFTMQAAPGHLLLAYFGYTNCPDVCPTTLSDIGAALRKLPVEERDRVDVAFVTVDPARDSGELLASYLDHFVARGHALRTTDAAAQQAAQDAFGVVARQVPEGDSYSIEHTAVTYVVDDTGTVVVEWPFGTQPDVIADDLRFLFEQQAGAVQADEERAGAVQADEERAGAVQAGAVQADEERQA